MTDMIKGMALDALKGWLAENGMTIALWGGGALFLALIVGTVIGKLGKFSGYFMAGAAMLLGAAYLMRPAPPPPPQVQVVERVVEKPVLPMPPKVEVDTKPLGDAITALAGLFKGKEEEPEDKARDAEAEAERERKRKEAEAKAEKERTARAIKEEKRRRHQEWLARQRMAKQQIDAYINGGLMEGNAAANRHQQQLRDAARRMGQP